MIKIKIIHFSKFKNFKIFINNVNVLTMYYDLGHIDKTPLSTVRIVYPLLIVFSRCG